MIGKKFTDLSTGKVIEVRDAFEDIAVLMDNSKIRVSRLMDRNYFDEYIDPKTFFHNEHLLNTFAQKIRQIPEDVVNKIELNTSSVNESLTNNFNDDPFRPTTNESTILPYDPEIEKDEIMKKYGIRKDPLIEAKQQVEKINSLLNQFGGETDDDPIRIDVVRDEVQAIPVEQPTFRPQYQETIQSHTNQQTIPPMDPVYQMFRGMKRSVDFNFKIPISEKIPRFDAIEMMEDSFEFSVIDFLASEFTNNLLDNPHLIREMIATEIRRLVEEGDSPKPKKKPSTKKTTSDD